MYERGKTSFMSWKDLKEYFVEFQLGHITKAEVAIAFHLWQLKNGITIQDHRTMRC